MERSPWNSRSDAGQQPTSAAAPAALTSDDIPPLILGSSNLPEFLMDFSALAARSFSSDGAEVGCSITVLHPRRPASSGYSDSRSRLLTELQHECGSGPGLAAALEQRSVRVADTARDYRWPGSLGKAVGSGVASLSAFPLDLGPDGRAAILLHSDRPGHFGEQTHARVEESLHGVESSLRLAARFFHFSDTAQDLKAALESRTVIDQALGIIMGQNRCSQHEAFTMLRAASSRRNMKVRDLAGSIVATVGGSRAETHFEH